MYIPDVCPDFFMSVFPKRKRSAAPKSVAIRKHEKTQ